MWQNVAIIIIGIAVAAYLVCRIYRVLRKPEEFDPCKNCPGCAIKNEKKEK